MTGKSCSLQIARMYPSDVPNPSFGSRSLFALLTDGSAFFRLPVMQESDQRVMSMDVLERSRSGSVNAIRSVEAKV